MSDNEDDIDNELEDDLDVFDDSDDDSGFDDFSQQNTLGDLWRNNPLVKIGVILAGVAFLIGGVVLFGGGGGNVAPSRVSGTPDVSEVPGGENPISPAIQQAIEEKDRQRVEQALREGESAMPTPIGPPKGRVTLSVDEPEEEDPLDRWRRMQEERRVQQANTPPPEPVVRQPLAPAPVDTRTPAINALAQAMAQQMESILQNQQISPTKQKIITSQGFVQNLQQQEQQNQAQAAAAQQAAAQTAQPAPVQEIVVPVGTIEYAQLITEANSDVPGPVLAQIVSGPLRGSRILGSFQVAEDYLVLSFNQVVVDGVSQPVNAVALDPQTTLPGVATEVDNRYFQRVVLPAAAAFIEGLASAISDSGRTSVFIENDVVAEEVNDADSDQEAAAGVEELGEEIRDVLDEEAANIQPLIRVESGTPLGILFVDPVVSQL